MKRRNRWILGGVGAVILLPIFLVAFGYLYLRSSLPQTSGTLNLPGLSAPLEIIRDRNAIPHIYAKSINDANFALGFLHAQDRLWQMEMNRRIAAGRLSELFGTSTLDTDRFLRTLGVHRLASIMVNKYNEETRSSLEAYAAGVNAFLTTRSGSLPPEFVILGVTPEPWEPADSVGWLKMMAWDLGGNWTAELLRLRLAQKLTAQQISEFLPPYPGEQPLPIRDLGELYRSLTREQISTAANFAINALPPLPEGAGSNNWVVAGSRTVSGKPLLANDPHLGLNAPAIWYFAELNVPGRSMIGATLPGSPMIVLGRNDRIAWGFTNTGPDVQDLYLEKIDPDDATRYFTPADTTLFDTREEIINVKGSEPVKIRVRSTRHGPVISDASRSAGAAAPKGYVLAFQWTALREDDMTVESGGMIAQATNWKEFLEGARRFHSPQQNMVYADVDGNIGFIAAGRVPIRSPDNDLYGMAPAPGWNEKYDWDGFIPFEKLPQSYNPASGEAHSANEKITPPDYKYFISSDWGLPYRANRIAEMLAAQAKHSPQTFAAMHHDRRSVMAHELLPLMLNGVPANAPSGSIAAMLAHWDGEMDASRPEPLLFTAWYRELTRLIYADELGPELFKDYWEQRSLFVKNVLMDKDGQSRWCDDVTTPVLETCNSQIAAALERAVTMLKANYGDDPAKWKWGDAHYAHSRHQPFSKNKYLAPLFDITVPADGDTYTVNVGGIRINNEERPFADVHGPSLRAIYDLADPDKSQFMHSTGQSGNRFSPYYDNFATAWARGEYLPMTSKRAEVEAGAIGTLQLLPQGK